MKILNVYPPNFAQIDVAFGVRGRHGICYAYGDTIYNPSAVPVPQDVIVHEGVHRDQQEAYGTPDGWWDTYIADPEQRLKWEVEAYHVQYVFVSSFMTKKLVAKYLEHFAMTLSGPIYGRMIGYHRAVKEVKCPTIL